MPLTKAFIPYGAYWSSPFVRWQGSLANAHSMRLAADVAGEVLAAKKIDAKGLDGLILGMSVPQRQSFYGAPWLAGMLGAPSITGATISQACATSARVLASAATEVETGNRACILGICCDRTSNGPHLYYPAPAAPGGKGDAEDWVWDNFNEDPWAGNAMIETAENVARAAGITRGEQDAITLLRYEQYAAALANGRAFQKRYMAPVTLRAGKKELGKVDADDGVFPTSAEGLAKLKPVKEGGTVTFGSQTHPADGNAGMVVCSREKAAELSSDAKLTVQILSFGEARVEKGMMPMAVVPAARTALQRAGIELTQCKAVKTHNPFAVNDVYFCKQTGRAPETMNRYGSPLVYGHPQGPTGMRLVMELIEELAEAGGGYGLFSGCAAGDSAMALVVKVG